MTQAKWPSTTRRPHDAQPLTWAEFEKALTGGALELELQPSAELLAEFREAFGADEERKTWQQWAAELAEHMPLRDAGAGVDQGDAGDSSAGAGGEEHAHKRKRRR